MKIHVYKCTWVYKCTCVYMSGVYRCIYTTYTYHIIYLYTSIHACIYIYIYIYTYMQVLYNIQDKLKNTHTLTPSYRGGFLWKNPALSGLPPPPLSPLPPPSAVISFGDLGERCESAMKFCPPTTNGA